MDIFEDNGTLLLKIRRQVLSILNWQTDTEFTMIDRELFVPLKIF